MKKIISLLLIIMICTALVPIYETKGASTNEYSLKVGKKMTLETNLKNAVWGSDNLSVATVSKKGVVKGVSEGTCTIVATANGKSELFNLKVTSAKKGKKGTLYIGKKGVIIDSLKMNINKTDIIFGETTIGDIYDNIGSPILFMDQYGDNEDFEKVDINTTEIYGSECFISLDKWKWYVFKMDPGQHQYYKEMVFSVHNIKEYYSPFTNGIYLTNSDYYILPTFSAKKAPAFDSFETDIYKKFSGYTTDNIKITRSADYEGASEMGYHPVYDSQDYWEDDSVAYVYYVRIKDANTNQNEYSNPSWWVFSYFYDKNRKCIGVSFYYDYCF